MKAPPVAYPVVPENICAKTLYEVTIPAATFVVLDDFTGSVATAVPTPTFPKKVEVPPTDTTSNVEIPV